jgi:hypothetical protein
MQRFLAVLLAAVVGMPAGTAAAAGPRVHVLIGQNAPPLERFAADELAAQLTQLFGAEVNIGDSPPRRASGGILLGSPATNLAVKAAVGDAWPDLSDQGHVLRSVGTGNGQSLVVGGGSPVATLWAVYELGHRFGIRYLTTGDVYPADPPQYSLAGFDVVLEPALRHRAWQTIDRFAFGPESWGLEEQRRVLRQLAKLKFNRVVLSMYAWQPFVDFECRGVRKQSADLWYGGVFPVGGDTAGRAAFHGAAVFDNPDFAGKDAYEERQAAAVALARGVIDTAHELGMTAAISFEPLAFAEEFARVLPDAERVEQWDGRTIGPGAKQSLDDAALRELASAQLRAYADTYPAADAFYLSLGEAPGWRQQYEQAWRKLAGSSPPVTLDELFRRAREREDIVPVDQRERVLRGNFKALAFLRDLLADEALLAGAGGRQREVRISSVDPALYGVLDRLLPPGAAAEYVVADTARRVAAQDELLAEVPASSVPSSLALPLADYHLGLLPQLSTRHAHTLLGRLRESGWEGYCVRCWLPGDLNAELHYLARAAFDPALAPDAAYDDFITPICGAGLAERVLQGYAMIEQATDLIDEHDPNFGFPLRPLAAPPSDPEFEIEPPPAWWGQVRDLYLNAMNEMYRGITRARGGARPVLLYHAKRLEFAFEYLNCIEAVRLAEQARASGNADEQLARLEAAVESMYNALAALGEVARDNSDRGTIAVLNAYGYRPLQAELARADEAAAGEE